MRESNTWRSVADNPGIRWELGKPSCRQWPFQRRFLVLVAESVCVRVGFWCRRRQARRSDRVRYVVWLWPSVQWQIRHSDE